jgi:hypothetical protein
MMGATFKAAHAAGPGKETNRLLTRTTSGQLVRQIVLNGLTAGAALLDSHPGWPQLCEIRRLAEESLRDGLTLAELLA